MLQFAPDLRRWRTCLVMTEVSSLPPAYSAEQQMNFERGIDPHPRKLAPSGSMTNLTEPLKAFLKYRMKTIYSKEWWDFVVNVNNMSSDHASLLYSSANLCPTFQNFLKTKEKELAVILQKRPSVKPRIFSGSERGDVPFVPSSSSTTLPSTSKKSCAKELDEILAKLYPDERSIIRGKPRTYGPISKQKKLQNSRKFQEYHAQNSQVLQNIQESKPVSLSDVLREDENLSTNTDESVHSTDFDQNRNKVCSMKKIKIIKKKKILTYTDRNDVNRVKYILESETPELKRDLIKKYRLKKLSVTVKKLTPAEIDKIVNSSSGSHRKVSDTIPRNVARSKKLGRPFKSKDPIVPALKVNLGKGTVVTVEKKPVESDPPSPNFNGWSPGEVNALPAEPVPNTTVHPTISSPPEDRDKAQPEMSSDKVRPSIITKIDSVKIKKPPSPTCNGSKLPEITKPLDKEPDTLNTKENNSDKINVDLKTLYHHGGIVPLGKTPTKSPLEKSKSLLTLKEKRSKDIVNGETTIPLKEKNILNVTEDSNTSSLTKVLEKSKSLSPSASPTLIVGGKRRESTNCLLPIDEAEGSLLKESAQNTKETPAKSCDVPNSPMESQEKPQAVTNVEEETLDADVDDVILIESPPEIIDLVDDDSNSCGAFETQKVDVKRESTNGEPLVKRLKLEVISKSELPSLN